MAITPGTVTPFKPFGGQGGTLAADLMTLPMDPSQEFQNGDVIVIDAGTRDASVNNAATGDIFGIVTLGEDAITANATIDRNASYVTGSLDLIQVYPAWPGRRFAGNATAGTATDQTGEYAADIRVPCEIVQSDSGSGAYGTLDVDATAGTDVAYTLEYVSPQTGTRASDSVIVTNFGREAGVGLFNPRVVFMFLVPETVFGATGT